MAVNPDRPQFQDTIDEAWGQSVADHVVRRYVDAAARDADLTMAPAELAGQVVAIGPAAGPVELELHNGALWQSLGVLIAGAVQTVTTDGYGNWDAFLPATNAKVISAVAVMAMNSYPGFNTLNPVDTPMGVNRVRFIARQTDGSGWPSGALDESWIAIYTT